MHTKDIVRYMQNKKTPQTLFILFFLFIAVIGMGTFVLLQGSKNHFDSRTKAAVGSSPHVVFVNQNNLPITQTSTAFVNLRLTSPWAATAAQTTALTQQVASANDVLGTATITKSITAGADDVNENDSEFITNERSIFIGNAGSRTNSWTGLRFNNVTVPKGAKINSAQVVVFNPTAQWITTRYVIAADKSANSAAFTNSSKPSRRTLTTARINHSSNARWTANTWYALDNMSSVVQEIVNQANWQSGNSMSIILKGTGGSFARKNVMSLEGNNSNAPRLVVSYTTSDAIPSITKSPTATNVPPTATNTIVPPTATPIPYTVSVELAEDAGFTKNYISHPYVSHPMNVTYAFADANPGQKLVYARFTSSSGQTQVFSNWIDLVALPTVTPTPTAPPIGGGHTEGNSMAMGRWTPNPKYDTCTNSADTARIKEIHDSFKVMGPDGKWYPTWHPPVDSSTGCKFGHEHGRDPHVSALWTFIQQEYGFDADKNGRVEGAELASAGLPFGYANEKLDEYNTANNITNGMRHEDHVGHKIEWENNVQRTTSPNYLPSSPSNNFGKVPTKVYCDFLMKPHQGTHSKDAFTNNLHELGYFVQCRDQIGGGIGTKLGLYTMMVFGRPGGFSIGSIGGGTKFISVGLATPANSPSAGEPSRTIPHIDRVTEFILRPQGLFSVFSEGLYEDWISSVIMKRSNGQDLVYIDPHFAVFGPSRFYWPGDDSNSYGITRSVQDKADNIGRSVDTCFMSENNGTEIARGGECSWMTNYGQIKSMAWDDPRSAFNGVKREMYFNGNGIWNSNGPSTWYTNPFGQNAVTASFPGAIKIYVAPVNNQRKNTDGFIDPNGIVYPFESEAIGGDRYYGGNGVHAPN